MGFVIKRMETDEELRGKAYVHWRSWKEAYPGLVDRSYLDALTLEKCEEIARRWPNGVLIAKDGENVVGFVACGKYRGEDLRDAGEIIAIYVLAAYYGKGVGKALMEAALAALDYPRTAVWVLRGNDRAIRFYEKCGFRFDGREQEITLGSPAVELRMIRRREQ